MMKLYSMAGSGNCYKVELTAALLGRPLEIVPVDTLKRESRSEAFLKRNPNGKVPVLELEDGRVLPESNAIIHYLAEGSNLIPMDPFEHASMLHWMFFEQYSHERYVAEARFWWSVVPGGREAKAAQFPEWHEKGHVALGLMEQHLSRHDYLVTERFTLADIALYAYTHVAEEGGFDMAPYRAIKVWIGRVRDRASFIPMREYRASS